MRKVLVSIAALGAALSAVPSMAQSWGYPGSGYGQPGYDQRGYGQPNYGGGYNDDRLATPSPWQVREMVERAIQRGQVSRGDARELREDVGDLFRLDQRSRYGNDWRAREKLQRKTMDVLRDLRRASRDGYRDDGYRYGDRDRWNR